MTEDRSRSFRRNLCALALLAFGALANTACSSSNGGEDPGDTSGGATSGGAGGMGGMPSMCTYPGTPYGKQAGKVVNGAYQWAGFAEGSDDQVEVKISDYYDCDGTKGVNALLIDVSATWCGACQQEAAEFKNKMNTWGPMGIHILTLMIEDANSKPASVSTALDWRKQYNLEATATAADPKYTFIPTGTVGLPYQLLVDPRTMKILSVQQGYSGDYSAMLNLANKNKTN